MKSTKLLIVLIISSAILGSCSIQKRYHRDGLNISWNHSSIKKDKNTNPINQDNESITISQRIDNNSEIQMQGSSYTTTDDIASTELVANFATTNNEKTENVFESESASVSNAQTVEKIQDNKSQNEKSMKQQFSVLKKNIKSNKKADEDDFILYVVLAFFIPPLAVFLYEGSEWTQRCTVNLILTLLCGIPGLIHALVIILGRR
jgi:uncharacterized membrane protein YqaE (UPF0057 family)